MNIQQIAKMDLWQQDGAVYKNYLFRFDAKGFCRVYDLQPLKPPFTEAIPLQPIAEFTLDKAALLAPHSNAVAFGNEFYAPEDEFPLLYSNIYNNYAKAADPLCGGCCVYRIQREGDRFDTTLVQFIQVAFTDDRTLWRSAETVEDVRPYGNFAVDPEGGRLYVFVMRDGAHSTRYFSFPLPKSTQGVPDSRFGIKTVLLKKEDLLEYFDVPYHNYIQGACFKNGRIYSVEGFDAKIHPALRIIDPEKKEQVFHYDFCDFGMPIEAEFIDFIGEVCCYGDAHGNLYALEISE